MRNLSCPEGRSRTASARRKGDAVCRGAATRRPPAKIDSSANRRPTSRQMQVTWRVRTNFFHAPGRRLAPLQRLRHRGGATERQRHAAGEKIDRATLVGVVARRTVMQLLVQLRARAQHAQPEHQRRADHRKTAVERSRRQMRARARHGSPSSCRGPALRQAPGAHRRKSRIVFRRSASFSSHPPNYA
jgi:hypothetical protein